MTVTTQRPPEVIDPAAYARALASSGPAYEAIQEAGEVRRELYECFHRRRRLPGQALTERMRARIVDIEAVGYVMNGSKPWSYQPIAVEGLFDLMGQAARAGSLTFRQRGILVAACASALGDAYCSLAWSTKLAGEAGEQVAGSVLRGDDDGLDPSERVLAQWARQITPDPNATDVTDIQSLRDAGYDDAQIFAMTAFVALRIAFSTVNDALGARPDRELGEAAPASVRNAVTFGRSVGTGTGEGRTGAK
jgi:alkylhydroperoxidase family enzyme